MIAPITTKQRRKPKPRVAEKPVTSLAVALRAAATEMSDPRVTAWVEALLRGDKGKT